jgi:1-acyl-sn-glycerol-3-phosphate acyltransferase
MSRLSPLLHWLRRAARIAPPGDLLRITMPHRALSMLLAYGLHVHGRTRVALRARMTDDLDARDPELVDVTLSLARAFGRYWFRAETEGVENVPGRGPALLVGNHNGGFLITDTYLTMAAIAERQGLSRVVRPLAHDFVFDDPTLRRYAQRFGAIRAGQGSAMRALERGELVLVYPGGDVDTFRPFEERGRIELAGRTGFVRLALRARVPIVPVVSAGTHEQMVILSRGDRVAKLLHMHRWARTEVFPIALSLPWGLTSAFLPYLPLPAQTTVAFGEPIAWPDLGPEAADDDALVHRCAREVEASMQALLDRISAGRRPWLGRPGRAGRAPTDRARSPRPAARDGR